MSGTSQGWDDFEYVEIERKKKKSIIELHNEGYGAYKNTAYEQAAVLYHEAVKLAQQSGDMAAECENLYWEGDSYYLDGKLQQALACLLEADRIGMLDAGTGFYNQHRIVHLAIRIPLSYARIRELMKKLEPYKGGHQIGESKASVLLTESELAYLCGNDEEALSLSQEAFVQKNGKYPSYNNVIYYHALTDSYRCMGEYGNARRILAEWKARGDTNHADYRYRQLLSEGKILHDEGHLEEAWDTLQQCYAEQKYLGRDGKGVGSLSWLVRVGLETGRFREVGSYLVKLQAFKTAESLHSQYYYALGFLRFYTAWYRFLLDGGSLKIDKDFEHEWTSLSSATEGELVLVQDPEAAKKHAFRWMDRAMELAVKIDTLLECSWRQEQLANIGKDIQYLHA